jgi:hypothetical protein
MSNRLVVNLGGLTKAQIAYATTSPTEAAPPDIMMDGRMYGSGKRVDTYDSIEVIAPWGADVQADLRGIYGKMHNSTRILICPLVGRYLFRQTFALDKGNRLATSPEVEFSLSAYVPRKIPFFLLIDTLGLSAEYEKYVASAIGGADREVLSIMLRQLGMPSFMQVLLKKYGSEVHNLRVGISAQWKLGSDDALVPAIGQILHPGHNVQLFTEGSNHFLGFGYPSDTSDPSFTLGNWDKDRKGDF